MSNPTAALLIIGNEILSGRTKDANLVWLGEQLAGLGIAMMECRVVPDNEKAIIHGLDALRDSYDYVFTTGGIGPTHDDITTACVAKAFGVNVFRHPEAEKRLRAYIKPENMNEARLRMADVPEGSTLVDNPISAAPGFRIGNVYVFAGVPRIMQAMFENIRHELHKGAPIQSRTLHTSLLEGTIATALAAIQNANPTIDIGSYPIMTAEGKLGVNLVARGTDEAALDKTESEIAAMLEELEKAQS